MTHSWPALVSKSSANSASKPKLQCTSPMSKCHLDSGFIETKSISLYAWYVVKVRVFLFTKICPRIQLFHMKHFQEIAWTWTSNWRGKWTCKYLANPAVVLRETQGVVVSFWAVICQLSQNMAKLQYSTKSWGKKTSIEFIELTYWVMIWGKVSYIRKQLLSQAPDQCHCQGRVLACLGSCVLRHKTQLGCFKQTLKELCHTKEMESLRP